MHLLQPPLPLSLDCLKFELAIEPGNVQCSKCAEHMHWGLGGYSNKKFIRLKGHEPSTEMLEVNQKEGNHIKEQ